MSLEDLKQALNNWQERIAYYERELSINANPEQKFELQKRIQEGEQEIKRIKTKINSSQEDYEIKIIEQNTQSKSYSQDRLIADNKEVMMKDVFICHASEDKQQVVKPLVNALKQANISYWYDEAEIKWGDSITKKVNEGLSISRFVIVVLSSAFLGKNWTQRELYSVLNIEASSGEVKILPLVVGTDRQEQQAIFQKLPLLNDKLYLIWEGNTDKIVEALRSVLTPK